MKYLLFLSALLIQPCVAIAQTPCTNHCTSCKIQFQLKDTAFNETFPAIEKKIKDFYANIVFHTQHDTDYDINYICTSDFIKRLIAANDLDVPGYATWLLRSGMQDGDDTPSRVLSVKPGANNTVIVNWTDMGHKGSTTLTMTESNGQWKINGATVPVGFNPL